MKIILIKTGGIIMFFKKKEVISIDVMQINAKHVSTGQIGGYIKKLYEEEGFRHIGYRFKNIDGLTRFIIYTLPNQLEVIQYFEDRCPAMVEEKCRNITDDVSFTISTWENGFEEVV